ncbi:MAG: ribosome biogenesis GTPase YlqF [Clostridia bacterium]|nr:ribosome biogenesis GTPase YlqF [Clostridia bacterium]
MSINWYPGHMAKAKRQLSDQVAKADVIVELCDARLPRSSRNPDLKGIIRQKNHLLIMQKSDLADETETARWLRYFRSQGLKAAAIDVNKQYKQVLRMIQAEAQERIDRAKERGINKTVRAIVVGVPNVGKSTLINRLYGSAVREVSDRPGVTRANQWVRVSPYLEILDTPGLLWPRLDDQKAALRLSYIAAVRDDIQDIFALAISLLDDMMDMKPEAVTARFKVDDASLRGQALLDAVCYGRGFLLKGNQPDEERGCRVVLEEFRSGKLGRITLESAPEAEA